MSKKHHQERSGFLAKAKKNIWLAIVLGVIGSIVYFAVTAPKIETGDLESKVGLHYHPHITITIDGVDVPVDKDIGIGVVHNPIHTHENDNIIHLEFEGTVKKTDIVLGKFFDIWGKEWTETSFMGRPIDANHTLVMKVDGVERSDGRNLLMKDKQQIALVYTTLK